MLGKGTASEGGGKWASFENLEYFLTFLWRTRKHILFQTCFSFLNILYSRENTDTECPNKHGIKRRFRIVFNLHFKGLDCTPCYTVRNLQQYPSNPSNPFNPFIHEQIKKRMQTKLSLYICAQHFVCFHLFYVIFLKSRNEWTHFSFVYFFFICNI